MGVVFCIMGLEKLNRLDRIENQCLSLARLSKGRY